MGEEELPELDAEGVLAGCWRLLDPALVLEPELELALEPLLALVDVDPVD